MTDQPHYMPSDFEFVTALEEAERMEMEDPEPVDSELLEPLRALISRAVEKALAEQALARTDIGWVRVSDDLPHRQKMVLLAIEDSQRGAVDYGFLDYADNRFKVQTMIGWCPASDFGTVTHWRWLPAPPNHTGPKPQTEGGKG